MVAAEKHVLYRFSAHHDSAAVDELLGGYTGYLVADAHAVYDHLYKDGTVTEVVCWAHLRRYFFKAIESDPERAKFALSRIGALFRIERTIADQSYPTGEPPANRTLPKHAELTHSVAREDERRTSINSRRTAKRRCSFVPVSKLWS